MGLMNTNTPAFDDDESTNTNTTAAAAAAPAAAAEGATATAAADAKPAAAGNAAAAAATTESKATAVAAPAAKKAGGLVVQKVNMNVLDAYKDAMRVEYNTLSQLTAQQGNLMDRETKKVLGDTVVVQLLSWQDAFVVSPEDEDAPDDVVRYSNDGVVCTDDEATLVADALADMRQSWPKARLKQRAVVVVAVESATKTEEFNGKLVQLDLSPASRVRWNRYMAESAYAIAVGKCTAEDVARIKITTVTATGGGNNTFTLAEFSRAG